MKVIDVTQDTNSSWSPFQTGSKAFMQNAYMQMGDIILKKILNGYTADTVVIISGLTYTHVSSTYSISEGWVYYNSSANESAGTPGQLYYVPSVIFVVSGGQVPIAKIVKVSDTSVMPIINNTPITNCDPTNFSDNISKNIHDLYTIEISAGTSGTGIADFTDFVNATEVKLNTSFAGDASFHTGTYTAATLNTPNDGITRTYKIKASYNTGAVVDGGKIIDYDIKIKEGSTVIISGRTRHDCSGFLSGGQSYEALETKTIVYEYEIPPNTAVTLISVENNSGSGIYNGGGYFEIEGV